MEYIHLAKWESRFWAWLIDILLVFALYAIIAGALASLYRLDFIRLEDFGVHGVLMFFYWTLLEGYNGQSIGKMALNLKVTDKTGRKAGFKKAALESFGKAFLLPLDCLIGWLAMPGSKLRLFNRVSGTIVIKVRYEQPGGISYIREKE